MMCMSRRPGGEAQVMRSFKAGVGEPVGSELTIKGEDIVLATGSRPLPLPGNPFSGALIDSTQALELDTFPSSAVIVGAGAVALEFASLWNAAGCEVTLLIRKDRVLSSWEKRASMTLTRELKRRGISVVTRASVDYVDTGANLGATVHYRQGGGEEERTAYGEVVLAAIGRIPNTDAGWFASNGIELEERGYVSTDAYGRTNVEGVWALGDITPGHALAHRAFEQASPSPKPSQDLTPSRYPTKPCRKSCSLSLKRQASVLHSTMRNRVKPSSIRRTAYPMLSNSRMLMSGEGGSMTIVSGAMAGAPDVPLVLGVHIVSPLASDLIAEAEQLVATGCRSPPRRGSFTRIPPSVNRSARRCLRRMAGLYIPDNPRQSRKKRRKPCDMAWFLINYRSSVSNRITK